MAEAADRINSALGSDLASDISGGDAFVDHAFERRFWRVQRSFLGVEKRRANHSGILLLVFIVAAALAVAFILWPGLGVLSNTGRSAVANDAVWSGTIRQQHRSETLSVQPRALSQPDGRLQVLPMAKPPIPTAATADLAIANTSAVTPVEPVPSITAAGQTGDPTVRSIQDLLTQLGYEPGPTDGLVGERTRGAVMAWQLDHGLVNDGEPNQAVLQVLAELETTQLLIGRTTMKRLSIHERTVLNNWCSNEVSGQKTVAHYQCLSEQMDALSTGFRIPPASGATYSSSALTYALASCAGQLARGPQQYFQCVGVRAKSRSAEDLFADRSR